MRKKFTLSLIVIFVFSLFIMQGCGKNEESEVIKIGAILPLSGPGSDFGNYIKEGINLATEEINRETNKKIEIIYEDSKNEPKLGINSYIKLINTEKPIATVIALSSVAKALAPFSKKAETIQMYIAVAIPDITDGDYRFRIYPEAYGMAGKMAKYSIQQLNAKSAAIIYINDDFGRTSLEAYTSTFNNLGGKIIFSESYELTQLDYKNQLIKLKDIKPAPDVIYLNGYGPAYSNIVKQISELNIKALLTADMTLGLPVTQKQVGSASNGAYFVDGKMSKVFSDKFKKKYDKEATSYAGYAYDTINMVYSVLKNKDININILKEGLRNIQNYKGAMGDISIKKNGDSNLEFVIKQIKNGNIKIIEE